MHLSPLLLAVLLLAQGPVQQQQQQQQPQQQQQQQRPHETLWHKVLRLTGISAMPSTSKGEALQSGDVWVAAADGGSRLRLTRDGGYESPIFAPEGDSVLALRQGTLVRVSTAGFLDPEPLFAVPAVVRLVGIDREVAGQVVVLTRKAGKSDLALLDLADRKVHSLSSGKAAEVQDAVARLARWDRSWQVGEPPRTVSLTVRPAGRGTDIYVQKDDAPPVDVSRCEGDRCGQPALAADGRQVVYVRAPAP